jgi:hypothetical protein
LYPLTADIEPALPLLPGLPKPKLVHYSHKSPSDPNFNSQDLGVSGPISFIAVTIGQSRGVTLLNMILAIPYSALFPFNRKIRDWY